MVFVMPKWNAHKVAAWDDLLIHGNDGAKDINLATATILNYMPIIGITELTVENALDAWCRMTLWECLYGNMIMRKCGPNDERKYFITLDDVVRHIGLETEGDPKTLTEFYNGVRRRMVADRIDSASTAAYVANGNRTLLEVVRGGHSKIPE